MRNQPKYNFFKNSSYAIAGLKDLIKTESSFKIELFFVIVLIPFICLVDIIFIHKVIMFVTLMAVLICEAINSAVERAIDLVTLEHHEMAKRAKDMGSAVVFLSISTCVITWLCILFKEFA